MNATIYDKALFDSLNRNYCLEVCPEEIAKNKNDGGLT